MRNLSRCLIIYTPLQHRGNTVNPHPHPQHNMDYSNNNPHLQFAPVPPATTNGYGTNGNSKSDLEFRVHECLLWRLFLLVI